MLSGIVHGDLTAWSVGESGGSGFSDESDWRAQNKADIDSIQFYVQSSNFRAIRVSYGGSWADWHGEKTGDKTTVVFRENEHIIEVDAWEDNEVTGLTFVTNMGRKIPVGNEIGTFSSTPYERRGKFSYLSGKSGSLIDILTFHWSDGRYKMITLNGNFCFVV